MPSIASLGVSVYARTGQFDKAMRRASRTVGKFGASLRRFSGYASVIAGGGLGVLAVKSFEAIDAQAKLSDQLGFQQEKLAGLQHAAQLAGVSTESISKALGLLGKNVVDAANGTGVASDSFKALGLDAKQLVRLPVAEQFNQITKAMQGIGNASERISIVRNIFGRSGQELLSLMKDGVGGLEAMQRETEKFGLAISRVDSAKVEEANDAFFRARQFLNGLATQFSVAISPLITEAANAFIDWGTEGEGAAERIHGAMTQVINVVAFLADAWNGVSSAMDLAAAGALKLAAGLAAPASIGFEAARKVDEIFGDKARAAAAVNPFEEFINNANGAADDLIAKALERSGTSSLPVVADFFKTVVDKATERAKAAAKAPPGVSDITDDKKAATLGSFKEVDLRRIALNSQAGISNRQEVHDPANDKIVELMRRLVANSGGGAVAV